MNNRIHKNTIMIAAGGTGGHIFPSLSIINQIQNHLFIIITDERGEDYFNNFFINKGINFKIFTHKLSSPSNKFIIKKLKSLFQIFISILKSILLIIHYKPDAIIGFGGYPSFAPIIAAKIFRVPSIIHEQNTVPGSTNKLLSKISTSCFQAFDNSFDKSVNALTTGNPILFEPINKKAPSEIRNLLILGGSLGAKAINKTIPHISTSLNIWHQTGKNHFEEVKNFYKNSHHSKAKIEPFIENMAEAYAWADIVICRAGAMTVSELIATKTIGILIPFPYAIDNHQTVNAEYLSKKGAGIVIKENDFSADLIDMELSRLGPEKLQEITMKLESLSALNPEVIIADYLCD